MNNTIQPRQGLLLLLALCLCPLAGRAQATFQVLHAFTQNGPHFPECTLVETRPGTFYGTTSAGSANSTGGTLFRIDSSGTLTYLHSFDGATEGAQPYGALLQAHNGSLYGVTLGGGSLQTGTIFKSDLTGHITVLGVFYGSAGDVTPYSLIQTVDGAIYGTVASSSGTGSSQVYRLDKLDVGITVYAFTSGGPAGPVMEASDGNLYGLNSNGSIYRLTPKGSYKTLYTFTGNDGSSPIGNLAQAGNGRLYGVNAFGGADNFGTLFSVGLDGSFRVEHAFTGTADGGFPLTGVASAGDGNVYGTTGLGPGTVFRIDTAGNFTTLVTFGPGGNPNFPSPAVLQGSDGKFYGVQTTFGGNVYSLDTGLKAPPPSVANFRPSSGAVGALVGIAGSNLLGATSVKFNGTAAAQIAVTSAGFVYAVVPAGATSGPISVTTPNGAAISTGSFTVN